MWLLALSYWIHLLTTIMWLGGLSTMGLIALPAWKQQSISDNQWLDLQKRMLPWVNGSMALLWISGFIQMTNSEHYSGFLVIDSTWAWAMVLKHVAVIVMTVVGLYVQLRIYPDMERLALLQSQQKGQREKPLVEREIGLLRINLVCAVVVLFFTAVATAV